MASMAANHAAWHEMRVLVTGASGFIGSHLVRRLRTMDVEVHGTSRSRRDGAPDGMTWHVADLSDPAATDELVRRVRPDVIFHLAGKVTGRRDRDLVVPIMQANLVTVVNLLAAATEHDGPHVVLASSIEEAGLTRPGSAAATPYALAKWAASEYALLFHRLWAARVSILRIAMTYGPAQPDHTKLLPYVIHSMLAGTEPRLSSGTRLVDWIYIDDVVDSLLAAARTEDGIGRVIDICTGTSVTIRDTIDLLRQTIGTDVRPRFGAEPEREHDRDQLAQPDDAARLLGWRPRIELADGLRRTVDWYTGQQGVTEHRLRPNHT